MRPWTWAEHCAAIGAGIVDVDWVNLAIVRIVFARKKSIGETALVDIITTEGVGRLEMWIESAFDLETSTYVVLLVYLLPVIGIGEETIIMFIIGGGSEADFLAQLGIVGGLDLILSVVACGKRKFFPLKVERGEGIYINDTTHGVAAIQCALRSTQYLDALNVGQLKIKGALI